MASLFTSKPTFQFSDPLFPFLNVDILPATLSMSQATRTIIFNTHNHLGLNAGVLLAWIALSLITISAITLIVRRKHRRALRDVEINANSRAEEKINQIEERQDESERELDEDAMVGYMRGEKTPEQKAEEASRAHEER